MQWSSNRAVRLTGIKNMLENIESRIASDLSQDLWMDKEGLTRH